MTATTSTNGRARKSLAEQIDRLDAILDGLAENLSEAVATAVTGVVKEAVAVAVQEAVHAAVLEVLTNAELHKRLGASQAPVTHPSVPVVVCLASTARRCWSWLVGITTDAYDTAKMVARRVASRAMEAVSRCLATGRVKLQEVREQVSKKPRTGWMLALALAALTKRFCGQLLVAILVAILVGVLVGVAFYVSGREIASVGCGLAGFAGSLLASAVSRLKKTLPLLMRGTL
jgi:hypothetical protein